MKMLFLNRVALSIVAIVAVTTAYAETQSVSSIEHAVAAFVSEQLSNDSVAQVSVQRLDKRLMLSKCEQAMDVQWSPGSRRVGRVTTVVACDLPKPWKIHVQASVSRQVPVLTLNKAVRKGDALTAHMVRPEEITIGQGSRLRISSGTMIEKLEPWIGYVFVQSVQSGRVLTDEMLEQPKLILRGDPVSINFLRGSVSIRAKGVALGSGSLHQQISVRNRSSGKVIEGTVESQSSVTIVR